MKTNELTGAALDWAVAKCEGLCEGDFAWYYDRRDTFKYSTNWSQGGPIMEREKINIAWLTKQGLDMEPEHYCVAHIDGTYVRYGPTILIAAMRCLVASKLGYEIDLPKELT